MVSDVNNYVKDEIKQLLEYRFIKPIRYTKWISKLVLVLKEFQIKGKHRF
jgi:hypothetical protein